MLPYLRASVALTAAALGLGCASTPEPEDFICRLDACSHQRLVAAKCAGEAAENAPLVMLGDLVYQTGTEEIFAGCMAEYGYSL
jgi:hypothetical protein